MHIDLTQEVKRGDSMKVNNGIEIFLISEGHPRWVKIRDGSLEEVKRSIIPIKECDISQKPGVYLLTCLVGEKKSYCGEGLNLKKRIAQHRCSEHNNVKDEIIVRAIRKYGWYNFEIRILERFKEGSKTKLELLDLEEAYIVHYNLLDNDIGYNVLARGTDRTGFKHSEETKDRISESTSGQNNPMFGLKGENHPKWGKLHSLDAISKISGENNVMFGKIGEKHHSFGKKYSQERRDKISASLSGKKKSPEHCIKISEANLGKKLSQSTKDKISQALSGEKNPNFGKTGNKSHLFGRKNSKETIAKRAVSRKIPVNQLDKNTGEIIKVWDSATDAGESLGINCSNIPACCNGKQKSSHGFRWEYVNISNTI